MPRKSYRVKFDGGSGSSLAGIIDRPDHTESFPCVVVSHCFTCNKDLKAIVRISRSLADAGIAVLRFDMTGLGNSEGEFSKTGFSSNLEDLQAAIDFTERELGHVTALLGHSIGGATALAMAATGDLPHLGAVITVAAPSDTKHLATLLAMLDPAIERDGVGRVTIGGRTWDVTREMLDDFRGHEVTDFISQVDVPTLVFHSPVDATVGFDHAIRIVGLIQGSPSATATASLMSLTGADHLLVENPADLRFVAETAASFIHRYAAPN